MRLKSYGHLWFNIQTLSSQQIAHVIRSHSIDILVELAGHTAGNKLDVLALRPAPIQVSYVGYPNTTGLPTIDYRITDGCVDPKDSKQQFTEQLVRLDDCFLCYTPPEQSPQIQQAPAATHGFVSFGSFNNMAKINPTLLDVWAKILLQVPKSVICFGVFGQFKL